MLSPLEFPRGELFTLCSHPVHTMACEPCGSCKLLVSQTVRKYCLLFYIIKRTAIRESNKKQKSRKGGFGDKALRAIKKTQRDTQMTFWCAEKDIWEIIRREMRNLGKGLSPERKGSCGTKGPGGRGEGGAHRASPPSWGCVSLDLAAHSAAQHFSTELAVWVGSYSLITFRMGPQHLCYQKQWCICTRKWVETHVVNKQKHCCVRRAFSLSVNCYYHYMCLTVMALL